MKRRFLLSVFMPCLLFSINAAADLSDGAAAYEVGDYTIAFRSWKPLKVSKPLMVFLWVMGIGIVFQQPVGKMLIPQAMAELSNGSSLYVTLTHKGSVTVRD